MITGMCPGVSVLVDQEERERGPGAFCVRAPLGCRPAETWPRFL